DEPTLHASSGLTRHFTPKPSYYALAHLQKTLGDYRFSRVIEKDAGNVYAYEYVNGTDKKLRIWAVWSPTGSNRQAEVDLPSPHGTIYRSEHMPLTDGPAGPADWKMTADGKVHVNIDEQPSYLWIR
ncbi:MAG TPA: hypothetical protein VFW40_09680, partial [Capsulimonadaceae bacterium]|nr:hypothetical protein [Capsulimonadaceae bacterium]